MRFLLMLLCFILGGFSVCAEEISSEQKKQLHEMLDLVNQRLDTGDISPLIAAMPPQLYEKMASILQKSIRDLQDDFAASIQKQFDDDGLKSYHFEYETVTYYQTGSGNFYALVPTKIELQNTIGEFQTLAIYDKGHWYLIQGGQKTVQNPVFLEIYPFLAEITIPPAQQTKIENQK